MLRVYAVSTAATGVSHACSKPSTRCPSTVKAVIDAANRRSAVSRFGGRGGMTVVDIASLLGWWWSGGAEHDVVPAGGQRPGRGVRAGPVTPGDGDLDRACRRAQAEEHL